MSATALRRVEPALSPAAEAIADIDRLVQQLKAKHAPLVRAVSDALARQRVSQDKYQAQADELATKIEAKTAQLRRLYAQESQGLATAQDIEPVLVEVRALKSSHEEALQAKVFAQGGFEDLLTQRNAIGDEIDAALGRRAILCRQAIRESAEELGERYRAKLLEAGEAFAELSAHAEVLFALEGGGSENFIVQGQRQAFGAFAGAFFPDLPVFPKLRAFADGPADSYQRPLYFFKPTKDLHLYEGLLYVEQTEITEKVKADLRFRGLIS